MLVFEFVLQSPSLPKLHIACAFGEPEFAMFFFLWRNIPYSNPSLLLLVWKLHSVRHTPLDEGSARLSAVSFKGYSV